MSDTEHETGAGVIAHLTVDGAVQAIAFYTQAFGAEELARHATPDGKLMHAALKVNGGVIYLNDEFPEHGAVSPKAMGRSPVTLHMDVADPDAVFACAIAAGAISVMPPQDMFWGARYGQVTDPFGHRWAIASPIKPVAS